MSRLFAEGLQDMILFIHLGWNFVPKRSRAEQKWSEVAVLFLFCSATEATIVFDCNFKELGKITGSDPNFFGAAELLQF